MERSSRPQFRSQVVGDDPILGALPQAPFLKQCEDCGTEIRFGSGAVLEAYEHLHSVVRRSDDFLDLRMDCFSRDEWVDSYSSRYGPLVAHLAFRSRQTPRS